MENKTIHELEERIRVDERLKQEREISDKNYARKLAETILFTLVGMFCLAVVGAILKLVILQ